MADDAIAYDGIVVGEEMQIRYSDNGEAYYITKLTIKEAGSGELMRFFIDIPASDLPTARVGDKVQVALFLRPEEAE